MYKLMKKQYKISSYTAIVVLMILGNIAPTPKNLLIEIRIKSSDCTIKNDNTKWKEVIYGTYKWR